MKRKLIAGAICVALLSGCASKVHLSETEIMQQFPVLEKATELLEQANINDLAFYSPEQMKEAQRAYDSALRQAESGNNTANASAKEVVDRINAAKTHSSKAKYVFEEVFVARNKALGVSADTLVPDNFNSSEKQFKKMLTWFEVGEEDRAKRDINELKNQYLATELAALKTNMLSVAQRAIENAEKQNLDDVTPILISQAKDEYQLALSTLEADRANTQKANVHSNKAIWLVERAKGVAEINQYFKNADFSEEQKVLWYQDQLQTAMSPFSGDLAFNQTNKEVIADVQRTVSSKLAENQMNSQRIEELNTQLMTLQTSSKDRESQITRDKDEALLSAQLQLENEQQAKREDSARFAGVQSLFNQEEATVYRQLDNVLIRAHGFSFKTGSSEIESSNFALLNKIIDAVRRFPASNILVTGHTDATGSAELNLDLSKNRAKTVADFMTKVGNIDDSRIESQGFGKEKPVASNETPEGRAQNRRVEILIIN
ncbi:OmpA family protein [Aliiglaciecola lipolytica]|uniref:OmpA family protein n=1 Tax=Aliiglaciecola lipolytica TaxID=477689 RepID=UPI001C0A1C71|nr:OmpA family protein [Aliiglaciecola lipolytica]MBU2876045.1 OmpA family protein [Aliiglaciecola lipolytica]